MDMQIISDSQFTVENVLMHKVSSTRNKTCSSKVERIDYVI
jgi:hypothetical protein